MRNQFQTIVIIALLSIITAHGEDNILNEKSINHWIAIMRQGDPKAVQTSKKKIEKQIDSACADLYGELDEQKFPTRQNRKQALAFMRRVLAILRIENPDERIIAKDVLLKFGDVCSEVIIKRVEQLMKSKEVNWSSIEYFGEIVLTLRSDSFKRFADACPDEYSRFLKLAQLVIEKLTSLCTHKDDVVKIPAITALGCFGNLAQNAVPMLSTFLDDKSNSVSESALTSLRAILPKPNISFTWKLDKARKGKIDLDASISVDPLGSELKYIWTQEVRNDNSTVQFEHKLNGAEIDNSPKIKVSSIDGGAYTIRLTVITKDRVARFNDYESIIIFNPEGKEELGQ